MRCRRNALSLSNVKCAGRAKGDPTRTANVERACERKRCAIHPCGDLSRRFYSDYSPCITRRCVSRAVPLCHGPMSGLDRVRSMFA